MTDWPEPIYEFDSDDYEEDDNFDILDILESK